MTQQFILFAILAAALAFFVWGRLRYDLVAVGALLVAVLTGLVPPERAFTGFGHPAVITVAAILVISYSLSASGLVQSVSRLLKPASDHPIRHVLALCGLAALLSAFMNNVGALALLLPVALRTASSAERPASQLLMPLSFSSLLGGLITLIGTPPNIIIASFRAGETGTGFGMFDFAPVGLAVAAIGILYIGFLGWRFLPQQRAAPLAEADRFKIEDYITEVSLPEDSRFAGRRLVELETLGQGDIAVVALERRGDRMLAPSPYLRLQAGDTLVLEADANALAKLVEEANLEMVGAPEPDAKTLRSERVGVVEVVVTPGSRMEGRTARNLRLHTSYGVNLLGVSRQGERITESLGQVRFQAGDVLLLQGEKEAMPASFAALGCLPLAERELPRARRSGPSWRAPMIFAAAIACVVSGVLPPQIAFALAALALVLTNAIALRDVYEAVDWPIIVLLGAMIPIGMAIETSGASETITAPILLLGQDWPIWVILVLMMVVTMLLTDLMNNAATAVLMAPIGVAVAKGLGASIDPFLMTVAIGASSTFLTPIGHQSNLLVMGPGGYRFGDYWRMGLMLDALIVIVSIPLILLVWPP